MLLNPFLLADPHGHTTCRCAFDGDHRMLLKAEVVAAGNDTPKLTDNKVINRLLKKVRSIQCSES